MSKAVHSRSGFTLMLLVVAMTIPWSFSGASASYATPPNQAVEEEPVAPTEVPMATDVPVEPTATNVLIESTATYIPIEPTATTPAIETAVALATETPEPGFEASLVFSRVQAELLLCADDSRVGESDMQYFGGEFSGAGTVGQCRAAQGATITLTDVAGVYGPYVFVLLPDQSRTFLEGQVQEGTYSVSYVATGYSGRTFGEQVVMDANGSTDGQFSFNIQHFVASEPEPDPIPEGFGSLRLSLESCRDADRAEQTDFLIDGFVAANSVDRCEQMPPGGQVTFTLQGTTSGGESYGPRTADSRNSFSDLPFGTYTITESIYGNTSEPFTVGGANGQALQMTVRNYFATEPVYDVYLEVSLGGCFDNERDGQVDYLLTERSEFEGASSCMTRRPPSLELTIYDSTNTIVATIDDWGRSEVIVRGVGPGTYTAQLEGFPISQPFEFGANMKYSLSVITYVDYPSNPEPPGSGEASLHGTVAYCTSDEYAGQVHYMLAVNLTATGTAECEMGPKTTGVVFVHRYKNSGDTEPAETWTLPLFGSRFDSDSFGKLPVGYYRVGFSPSGFGEPIELSMEFPLRAPDSTEISVYYFGSRIETSILQVRKDICANDVLAGTTDFFIQQEPVEMIVATDETMQCRVASAADGQFTFTLTDVDSGETVLSGISAFPEELVYLSGIPAGIYTLTEQNFEFTRTSDPFEVDPSGGDYSIIVRNYTEGTIPPYQGDPAPSGLMVWAYDCVNDDKAGTSEFYYNPDFVGTDPELPEELGDFSASGVENCKPAGQYAFELDNGPVEGGTSATTVFPMIHGQTGEVHLYLSSPDGETEGPVPAGTYVLRETMTGFESEPIDIEYPINMATFYRYAAAPTPTPTNAPEPTASATATETADKLLATDVVLTVIAGQTISGNLNDYVSGGVPPYTFASGTLPIQGTLLVNPDGTFTFSVNADAVGTDSFTFTVTDSQPEAEFVASATDSGLVSIVIAAPGQTPTVTTGTVEPGGDPDGDGNDPRATAPAGNPGTGDGGVTTLPSTGQGQNQSWNGLLQVLLLTGLALILLAAAIRQHGRRS